MISSTCLRSHHEDTCSSRLATLVRQNASMTDPSAACLAKVNIVFIKTHKTGSSTLLNVLLRFGEKHNLRFAFPNGRNDFHYPSPFKVSQVNNYKPGDCFNIICNHMRFNQHEVAKLLPPGAMYISILRNPVDVFESAFHYYHRIIPLTWQIGGDDKLATFLDSPQSFYGSDATNSYYLRNLLTFDFGLENNLEDDDPRVMMGIHKLSHQLDFVLLTEYFEESMILLKDLLCWTTEDILYFKQNVRRKSSVSNLSPELIAKALQWNGADWKLYQHFNATFWERVEAFGMDRMRQELKTLRRSNDRMKSICIEEGEAVEVKNIQDESFKPWQPLGESSILGYNLRKNIDSKLRDECKKMLMPELQYLSQLGVNLWLTRLWGWLKDKLVII